jgi:hypothetical protein
MWLLRLTLLCSVAFCISGLPQAVVVRDDSGNFSAEERCYDFLNIFAEKLSEKMAF